MIHIIFQTICRANKGYRYLAILLIISLLNIKAYSITDQKWHLSNNDNSIRDGYCSEIQQKKGTRESLFLKEKKTNNQRLMAGNELFHIINSQLEELSMHLLGDFGEAGKPKKPLNVKRSSDQLYYYYYNFFKKPDNLLQKSSNIDKSVLRNEDKQFKVWMYKIVALGTPLLSSSNKSNEIEQLIILLPLLYHSDDNELKFFLSECCAVINDTQKIRSLSRFCFLRVGHLEASRILVQEIAERTSESYCHQEFYSWCIKESIAIGRIDLLEKSLRSIKNEKMDLSDIKIKAIKYLIDKAYYSTASRISDSLFDKNLKCPNEFKSELLYLGAYAKACQGLAKESLRDIKKALAFDVQEFNPLLLALKWHILRSKGETALSLKIFQTIKKKYPRHPSFDEILYFYAIDVLACGKIEKAKYLLKKVARTTSNKGILANTNKLLANL